MGGASAVSGCGCGCGCGRGLSREVHFQPKDPFSLLPGTGSKQSDEEKPFPRQRKPPLRTRDFPAPETPNSFKVSWSHGCCGGGGGWWVLGGAWGCGSALPRAERCGAVPGAVPVRLPVRAGWLGCPVHLVLPTPFCFPTAEPKTLSSRSSWFQGPPRAALIGWGGCPGRVNLRERGRGAGAGLQRALRPGPPGLGAPERARPPGVEARQPAGSVRGARRRCVAPLRATTVAPRLFLAGRD